MKAIALVFAFFAVFSAVGAQLPPGYAAPPYNIMSMGYAPMGYPMYAPPPPPPVYNSGYNTPGFGGSETANANSNTNVNSNSGGGAGRW